LNENAFATPTWAIDKEILRRIEPIGALNRVRNAQNSVLNNLLSSSRFARMAEQTALDGNAAYQPVEFLADVRKGVWMELDAPTVSIDAYRRNLQRAYLDLANTKLNAPAPALPQGLPAAFASMFVTSGDERPLYRSELRALNASIEAALARSTDSSTRAHLEGARDQIAKILNPQFAGGTSSGTLPTRTTFTEQDVFSAASDDCWPDYVIRP